MVSARRASRAALHRRALCLLLRHRCRGATAPLDFLSGWSCAHRIGRASVSCPSPTVPSRRCSMGDARRNGARGTLFTTWTLFRTRWTSLSSLRGSTGCAVVCAASSGEGHGDRRPQSALLARFGPLSGREARELDAHGWLPTARGAGLLFVSSAVGRWQYRLLESAHLYIDRSQSSDQRRAAYCCHPVPGSARDGSFLAGWRAFLFPRRHH